jgi:Na+/melibiose symporter-like transporter
VLIVADLGRAILIGLIPFLATLGLLRVEYLYSIALLLGVFTVFFDLAYQAYLPALVGREALAMGNSTLQVSASVAEAGGPGLGGLLIQWLTAPIALVTDAASYLISAISLSFIRKAEPEPVPHETHPPLRHEIAAGLALVYRNPHLRALAGSATTFNLFAQAVETVFVLYATRDLGLEAGVLGLIIACGSVGALIGSVAAVQLSRRFGLGRVLLGAVIIECVPALLIPLAAGPRLAVIGLLALGFFLPGIGLGISNVLVISLRQAVTPDDLLGRMNASYRTLTFGMIPLGALLGGGLGEVIGLRATLLVGALGLLLSIGWVVFSPISRLRALPTLDTGLPTEPDTG